MIEHAKECDLRDQHQLKAYKVVGHQIHAVIFFNCVHDIVGAKFNGNYIAKENFNRQQKAIVDGHKKEAYEQIEGIDFHYIMNENGIPSKIPAGNNTNVSGDISLPTQDIVPPPNPYNHNAPYEDPTHIDYMITMRCPCHEICNTAALIPEGDGSIPLIGDSRNGLSVSDYDVSGDLQTQDTVRLPNTSDHSAPYQAESFIRGLTHVARTPPLHESRNTASRILRDVFGDLPMLDAVRLPNPFDHKAPFQEWRTAGPMQIPADAYDSWILESTFPSGEISAQAAAASSTLTQDWHPGQRDWE